MITRVGSVSILSRDPKKLAQWYRDKLDFEIVGGRAPYGLCEAKGIAEDPLTHLCRPCDAWEKDRPGGRTGIWLQCGDDVALRRDEGSGLLIPSSNPDEMERSYRELEGNTDPSSPRNSPRPVGANTRFSRMSRATSLKFRERPKEEELY